MENGNLTDVNSLDASNINSTVLTTTTQPPHTNNNDVATTAFVHNELIDYALLNPITQTFTGNNNFITQAIGNNSTLVATTAFIKNQNYITAASLAGYALLDPPTTQIWGNVITPKDNWWYGNTFSYDTIESVNGFSIKSDPGPTATTYALIDSIGSISTTSTINSVGTISSDAGLNIPSISPLITIDNNGTIAQSSTGMNNLFNTTFTGTSNQLSIKAFGNVGSSTISQSTSTLNISAVTNNASSGTTLILSTRISTNGGCVLFNGNSGTLAIAQNTSILNLQAVTSTNISSPTFNVTSTTSNFTGSGVSTFSGVAKFNSSCQAIFPADIRLVDTTNITQLYQNGNTGLIIGNFNSSRLAMQTKNSIGTIALSSVIIENENHIILQGSTGNGIDILDNQITLGGLTPLITNPPLASDSSSRAATTSFVKGQGYALLNTLNTQTWGTSQNTFTGQTQFNNYNNYYYGGTFTSRIGQLGNDLIIENVSNTNGIRLKTLTTGLVTTENIVCLNGNQAYLQGSTGNTINITGQQATIGGALVPIITTEPSLTSNNNEIASTAFVKGQSYATTSSLSSFALLNANQTFTGNNTFINSGANVPLRVMSNTPNIGTTAGNHYIATANGEYNSLVSAGDYVVFAGDSSGAVANANLTLTSWSNTRVGIRITGSNVSLYGNSVKQYSPFYSGYNDIVSTLPAKDQFDIGYQITIAGSGFTGQNWITGTNATAYNIMTINWNGLLGFTLGVWHVNVVITTNCIAAPASVVCWSTVINTILTVNCAHSMDRAKFSNSTLERQVLRLNFVLNVTNLTTIYYLNFWLEGGTFLDNNLAGSEIVFTRIA